MSLFGYQDLAQRRFLALDKSAQAPIIHLSTPKIDNYCYFYILSQWMAESYESFSAKQ